MSNPLDFLQQNSTLINAGAQLLGKLVSIGIDYITASEQRRAELLEQADQEYAAFRGTLAGLDASIAGNNKQVDAEITAKFPKS